MTKCMPKSILTTHQAPSQTISSNARTNMVEHPPKSTKTRYIHTSEIDVHVTTQTNPNPIPIPVTQTPISSEGTSERNVSIHEFVYRTSMYTFYVTISLNGSLFTFYSKLPQLENILCGRLLTI